MSQAAFSTYRLHFPAEVTTEAVAELLRTLASESRGGLLSPSPPVIFETWLARGSVSWWLHGPPGGIGRLQAAAERALPGLRFEQDVRPRFEIVRALELRVDAPERLLDSERAEASVARLLGVCQELGRNERLLVQWQIGVWLPRSPIPPAGSAEPPTIWNLPDWGKPVRDTEQVQAARKKQAEHLFAAVGRVAVAGAGGSRANQLTGSVVNAYQLLRAPGVGVSRRSLPSWWVRRRLDQAVVPRSDRPAG